MDVEELQDLATAARVMSKLGLVDAFGHVSARFGSTVVITAPRDLSDVTAADLITLELGDEVPPGAPAESWAHAAVYRRRPDVLAVARAQPQSSLAVSVQTASLPTLTGQAAWLGEKIPVHPSALLLRSRELADRAAQTLGTNHAMLLRGNGAITVGSHPGLAVARMWLLANVCQVWAVAQATGRAEHLSADEAASWRDVQEELLPRLWHYLLRISAVTSPVPPRPEPVHA